MSSQPKLTLSKQEFKSRLNQRIAKAKIIEAEMLRDPVPYIKYQRDIEKWSTYNADFLQNSFDFHPNKYSDSYFSERDGAFALRAYNDRMTLSAYLSEKVHKLELLIERIELMSERILTEQVSPKKVDEVNDNKIFVVHGHNEAIKEKVARTLTGMGLHPIILHEQPNGGQTVIEKFERHADAGFAIILLTDDDIGSAKTATETKKRARQNVIFELGFFIGRLTRRNVFILYSEGVELPSDIQGMLYCQLDMGEAWRFTMAKELKAVGYAVDLNRLH